jgi:RimJ/RimL family protein N-acetyltransferase
MMLKPAEYPLVLSGEVVNLIRLEEEHFDELVKLAQDKRIWQFYIFDGTDPDQFINFLKSGLMGIENGTQYPFVILDKKKNKIIGSTRFLDIQPQNKKLEIGATWLHPDYWGTAINLECKLLLLTYCFEVLGTFRVQLKTDENNIRSRKAIEKIGGKFEGVLRNDMIRVNGTKRNSAYFSIIDEEWLDVKARLTGLYYTKKRQ